MRAYSEDLRKNIIAATERGTSKAQVSRLFDVSLSSVKRYTRIACQGGSLTPKKGTGRPPKIDETAKKVLEEDIPPYSPDFKPIEKVFAKIKGLLRKTEARTREALVEAMGTTISAITAQDARGFFEHSGYGLQIQSL